MQALNGARTKSLAIGANSCGAIHRHPRTPVAGSSRFNEVSIMCTRGLDCGVPQDLHLNGPSSFQIRVARAARRMASMDGLLPHVQISGLSRRRLAR